MFADLVKECLSPEPHARKTPQDILNEVASKFDQRTRPRGFLRRVQAAFTPKKRPTLGDVLIVLDSLHKDKVIRLCRGDDREEAYILRRGGEAFCVNMDRF